MEIIKTSGVRELKFDNSVPVKRIADPAETEPTTPVAAPSSDTRSEITSLARQLSDAATRAASRDAQLGRKELAELAKTILDRVCGGSYQFSKSAHDAFVPNTEDPELLERARQATAFLNGKEENPFGQLAREQLSLIVYDDGGEFTTNERNAAWQELSKRECEWTVYMGHKISAEIQSTGSKDQGLYEILDYYRSLPAIEQAQLGNYEADIMMQFSMSEVEWPEFNTSLIDMIAKEWEPAKDDIAKTLDPQAEGSSNGKPKA
ncbi:hypothetical protein [Pseudomonas sp. NPDC089758]|uniref:hypothetical protein n=1 Tax=Pseudomonas sp. NPDC089758 TaxID=3364473 RepID=UPI003812EB63